eukprot:symbB.v1.2.026460.t2/scaffold2648.1/size74058/1
MLKSAEDAVTALKAKVTELKDGVQVDLKVWSLSEIKPLDFKLQGFERRMAGLGRRQNQLEMGVKAKETREVDNCEKKTMQMLQVLFLTQLTLSCCHESKATATRLVHFGYSVDRDATAFANELASIGQPEALNAGVQLFKLNRSLTADYRMSYEWHSDAFKEDNASGVGCSLPVSPVVVFEARRGQKVFIFTLQNNQWVVRSIAINDWAPASCKYLYDERNFYLIDASLPEQWDAFVVAKTIKACSPDRRHHSDFVKDGGTYVYVEAWSAEEVKAAHPYLEGAPELTEMLRRFEQVGGNLRVLLSYDKNYAKYVVQQKTDVQNFEALIAASYGLLDTEGEKNADKLFTYLSKDGTSSSVGFASTGAMEMVLNAHYDGLMKIWSNPNNPKNRRFLLEQFVGTIFTTSLLNGKPLDCCTITKTDIRWEYSKCEPLTPGGWRLLECDSEAAFDQRWREAVEKGGLDKVLLHSPEQYPGVDYLLDVNHGIQVTQSDKHTIAPRFLQKLRTAFAGQQGYRFTLTFMVVQEPDKFKPRSKDFNDLMGLARGPEEECVFSSVSVNVVQAILKQYQKAKSLSTEEVFKAVSKDDEEKVPKDAFMNFLKSCDKEGVEDFGEAELGTYFEALDPEKEGFITKEHMLMLIRSLKKVVKETTLTDGPESSTAVTKLEVGEVVELLNEPSQQGDMLRAQCRSMRDGTEGWVTLKGNQGSTYLSDGGLLWR